MSNIGNRIKSELTDAEKAEREGLRAIIINHPFGAAIVCLVLGALTRFIG